MRGLLLSLIGTIAIVMSAALGAPSAALAQMAPNGSYMQSCVNATIANNALMADCKMRDGTRRTSTLYQPYDCHADIGNSDGNLVCGSVSPGPTPAPMPTPMPMPMPMPMPTPMPMPMPMPTPMPMPSARKFAAKFESSCFGETYYLVRRGDTGEVIRFHLDLGEKVHLWLPRGSTYAKQCNSYPSSNSANDTVEFE